MVKRRGMLAVLLAALVVTGAFALYEAATWPRVAALAGANPTSTAFIDRYLAQERSAGRSPHLQWRWVPYDAISDDLKRAVLVSEDINFFSHHGFDVGEIEDAVRDAWQEKELPRGASTITQQLAKNLWLSPSRNPLRKLKETILTVQLERDLSKRRILELYLNVVEMGPGIYGAEAAARHYFGIPAADLDEEQAAELAAGLPKPSRWHPGSSSRAWRKRVVIILRRMERAQFLRHQL
jgi:monofunctional biosynthetic peptidoglycan transglycosylase